MPQGSVRGAAQNGSEQGRAVREVLASNPGRGGDTYSNRRIAFMLGRQIGTAADRIEADQRRMEVEFNAWVRDQERSAA